MKVTSRTTQKQIVEALQSENYHMLYRGMHYDYKPMASDIIQAAKRKCLIWEGKKITITDREDIVCFACTKEEWSEYLNKFREKQKEYNKFREKQKEYEKFREKQKEYEKELTKSHLIGLLEHSKSRILEDLKMVYKEYTNSHFLEYSGCFYNYFKEVVCQNDIQFMKGFNEAILFTLNAMKNGYNSHLLKLHGLALEIINCEISMSNDITVNGDPTSISLEYTIKDI